MGSLRHGVLEKVEVVRRKSPRLLSDKYSPLPWWEGTKGRGKKGSYGKLTMFSTPTFTRLWRACPPPSRGRVILGYRTAYSGRFLCVGDCGHGHQWPYTALGTHNPIAGNTYSRTSAITFIAINGIILLLFLWSNRPWGPSCPGDLL